MDTHAHDLPKRLESSARTLPWLAECFQQCRNGLIDGLRADVLLQYVERLRGSRANVRLIVDERCANHVDNFVFVSFALRIGSTLPVQYVSL